MDFWVCLQIGAPHHAVRHRGAVAAPPQKWRRAADLRDAGRLPHPPAALAERGCGAGDGGGVGGGEGRQDAQGR